MHLILRFALVATLAGLTVFSPLTGRGIAVACAQPGQWDVAAAFDRAANGLLAGDEPQLPASSRIHTIPPSLLKAVGWVESGWRQFTRSGRPLLSGDFGYGIMQITSGMDGAFGRLRGSIDPESQSRIASDFQFNIAYGARMLAQKWAATPRIGDGDPTTLENWYYALWAYNGWGWVNNPNNPRFAREGTPATYPASYPYQERVLYLVAHPPKDSAGNPLWQAAPVSLPSHKIIGTHPGTYTPKVQHHEAPPVTWAVYQPGRLLRAAPGTVQAVNVQIANTGTGAWLASGPDTASLTYHLFTPAGDPWKPFSPFSAGVVAFGQGAAPLPHDVLPGHAVTVHVLLQAPKQPGVYRVAWDLQRGAGTWLSQEGVPPRAQMFHVTTDAGTQGAVPVPPTRAASARERLLFIRDTSVPDGSAVGKKTRFEKGWLVFNAGTATWGQGWQLVRVAGRAFGAKVLPVPTTRPCRAVDLIAALRAPNLAGHFTGAWRMRDPAGHLFGEKLTVSVVVSSQGPGPSSTPTPTPAPRPRPSPTATPVG